MNPFRSSLPSGRTRFRPGQAHKRFFWSYRKKPEWGSRIRCHNMVSHGPILAEDFGPSQRKWSSSCSENECKELQQQKNRTTEIGSVHQGQRLLRNSPSLRSSATKSKSRFRLRRKTTVKVPMQPTNATDMRKQNQKKSYRLLLCRRSNSCSSGASLPHQRSHTLSYALGASVDWLQEQVARHTRYGRDPGPGSSTKSRYGRMRSWSQWAHGIKKAIKSGFYTYLNIFKDSQNFNILLWFELCTYMIHTWWFENIPLRQRETRSTSVTVCSTL